MSDWRAGRYAELRRVERAAAGNHRFRFGASAQLEKSIAEWLHHEVASILGQPEATTLLASLGSVPAFIAAEGARWGEAARSAGVRPD